MTYRINRALSSCASDIVVNASFAKYLQSLTACETDIFKL